MKVEEKEKITLACLLFFPYLRLWALQRKVILCCNVLGNRAEDSKGEEFTRYSHGGENVNGDTLHWRNLVAAVAAWLLALFLPGVAAWVWALAAVVVVWLVIDVQTNAVRGLTDIVRLVVISAVVVAVSNSPAVVLLVGGFNVVSLDTLVRLLVAEYVAAPVLYWVVALSVQQYSQLVHRESEAAFRPAGARA